MGKNQNWQRRVESAEARRQEQRARKARKGDRESYRIMASDLMSYLGTTSSSSNDGVSDEDDATLHVWVDSPPSLWGNNQSKSSDSFGTIGGDGNSNKRQGKKQQDTSPTKRKGQRHKATLEDQQHDSGISKGTQLCGNHFFFNKCAGAVQSPTKGHRNRGSKTTICKLYHLEDALSTILTQGSGDNANIAVSADVAGRDTTESTDGSIGMLWYLNAVVNSNDSIGKEKANEALQTCLLENKVGAASIVYIVWGTWLLYDRNRGGLLERAHGSEIAGPLFVGDANGERRRRKQGRSRGESMGSSNDLGSNYDERHRRHRRSRGESMGSSLDLERDCDLRRRGHARSRGESMGSSIDLGKDNIARSAMDRSSRVESMTESRCEGDKSYIYLLIQHLPGSVLETILAYLPDIYTGSLPLVCKSWHTEIGQTSPNLWRHLLLRKGLPMVIDPTKEPTPYASDQRNARDRYRDAYIGHYEAIRDVRAIAELFRSHMPSQLQLPVHKERPDSVDRLDTSCSPNDATILPYNSNPGAPRASSGVTTSVKVWADGKIIMSCCQDCTVRLFEAVNNGGSLGCRQIVCVTVSPEPKSKRGQWLLTGMNLDENYVCCACNPGIRVESNLVDRKMETPHLLIIEREDILCAAGGGDINRPSELDDEAIHSINLREKLVDYLLTDVPDDVDVLIEHIKNTDLSNLRLQVITDSCIVACGKGRFLIAIEIAVPVEDDEDIGVVRYHHFYQTFLYSADDKAFVWSANVTSPPGRINHMVGGYATSTVLQNESASTSLSFHAVATISDRPMVLHVEVPSKGRVSYHGLHKKTPYQYINDLDTIDAVLYREVRSWNDIWNVNEWNDVNEENLRSTNYDICHGRPAAITSSAFVVAHNISVNSFAGRSLTQRRRRAVLTLSPLKGDCSNRDSWSSLTLKGDAQVLDIQPVRADHVMLLCRTYAVVAEGEVNRHNAVDADEDGDRPNPATTGENALCIILIHIQSQREIARYNLMRCTESSWPPPHFIKIVAYKDTIALEIVGEGLLMSGRGVRNLLTGSNELNERGYGLDQKQAKKKKTRKKMAKKDGFSRGLARYVT